MVSQTLLVGRLGVDPTLRGEGDKQFCTFTLATDNFKGETDWHRIIVFGKSAPNCAKFLVKGSTVAVEGRISYGQYEKDGQKIHTTEIAANRVSFLGGAVKPEEGESFA